MRSCGVILTLCCMFYIWQPVESSCNEAICASQVSKCMLLKSCECDMSHKKNCSCCKDCHQCLAGLYLECCSCVGMCPPAKDNDNMLKTSSIEDLSSPIPDLFDTLTEDDDLALKRWKIVRYPAHENLLYYKPDEDFGGNNKAAVNIFSQVIYKNCTVAFLAECSSLSRCKGSCKSMGANRFRWFHEYGCCECVGHTCLDYGKSTAMCTKCPDPDESAEDILEEKVVDGTEKIHPNKKETDDE